MAKSIFKNKDAKLNDHSLLDVLHGEKETWDLLLKIFENDYPNHTKEWKYYGAAWGWSLVIKAKKKTLLYMTPSDEMFSVSMSFDMKEKNDPRILAFSNEIQEIIESAKTNNSGHTFDIEVKEEKDLELVRQLLAIKKV